MPFAHDTEANLRAAADLVNTARRLDGTDALTTPEDLRAFRTRWRYTGRHDGDAAELAAVRRARTRVGALWAADRDAAADQVNAMLRDADAVPSLARHDHMDWHLHATADDAPLASVVLAETALAAADLVRSDEWDRMGTCAAEDCDAVLLDLSRNRSRRFCDVNGCANRAHVAAYRARRAARTDA
ncbi:CGNR zinc finger domain-containing protein [Cellulomonas shaoxiangyii]|uniref:CGNR zinc finger domain-containing protein n=1 Tax=Cellulomonas shaoxiangyii TaxID=2566013 RepID=A0A4P7SMF3_9CELL|nr:CGNR zinc finger domain-containing protein [Cellulomonas shaoxiangyii]QCB94034.1 CGNR zinc finger domain-containing protein [Cellulomonas shaoxiangyii]TGY85777.1 CGNR zinc finger domain-containing protein [Cellulomonas shaoxiangyii]